jgi:hypothetical protein
MSEDLSIISETLKTLEIRTMNISEKIQDFNISSAIPGDIIGYSGNSWVPVKSDQINTSVNGNENESVKTYASFAIENKQTGSLSGNHIYIDEFKNLTASPDEINTSLTDPNGNPVTFTSEGVYLIIVNFSIIYIVLGGDVEIISDIIKVNNGVETTLSTVSVVSPGGTITGGALPSSNLSNYDFRTYTLSGNNVIDANGNVIFTSVGSGSISFTTSDGVFTSNNPDQYILTSAAPPSIPSGNFSIEFYTKFGPNPSDYHYNFYYNNASTNSTITMYIRSNGRFYFETWHNSPSGAFNVRVMEFDPFNISGGGTWDSTNFNHFVLTYSGGGTEKFYLNGSLISSSISGGFSNNIVYDANEAFNDLYLGGGGPGSSDRDKLDETTKFHRMYDGALSQPEITSLYQNRDNIPTSYATPGPFFQSLMTHHSVNRFTEGEILRIKISCIEGSGQHFDGEIQDGSLTVQKLD